MKCNRRFYQSFIYTGITLALIGFSLLFINRSYFFENILILFLGVFIVIIGLMGKWKHEGRFLKLIKWVRRILILSILLFVTSFLFVQALIIHSARNEYKSDIHYMVILGAGLDGDVPRASLKNRLDKSIIYLKNNPDIKVIVSGGQGPGESITEAEAMKRYLVERDIDANRIIKENQSTSTYENILYSKKLFHTIDANQKKILIVTNNFHLYRAKYFAKKLGFQPYGIPASTPYYLLPVYTLREYLAIIKAYILQY